MSAAKFSLKKLIAWLEKQNPRTRYDGGDSATCVFCQWLSSETGRPVIYVGGRCYGYDDGREIWDARELEERVARALPNTFGAALKRARAALAKVST